jgi:type V secretory pathway adhesin AidA
MPLFCVWVFIYLRVNLNYICFNCQTNQLMNILTANKNKSNMSQISLINSYKIILS